MDRTLRRRAATKRFGLSIRTRLVLVSAALLVVPWIGYQYIQAMESYLRSNQEAQLLSRAQVVAALLREKTDIFALGASGRARTRRHLYVRPLDTAIQLDGYAEDWEPFRQRFEDYSRDHVLFAADDYRPASLSFRHQLGTRGNYLYAIFMVRDESVVYRAPRGLRLDKSDHLKISMTDAQGQLVRYQLATIAPGWVNAHRMPTDGGAVPLAAEVRIKGEWQETAAGYNVEIRIPLSLLGDKLAFAVGDVDDPGARSLRHVVGTAAVDNTENLATIVVPSPQAEHLLQQLERPHTRVWVIDSSYRVIAQAGDLRATDTDTGDTQGRNVPAGLLRLFYEAVLPRPNGAFHDSLSSASRLEGEEFALALRGEAATRWRKTSDPELNVLTATYPVRSGDTVLGAVAIEETNSSILILQNRAIETLINISLPAFFLAAAALLVFATRLSLRVRRLRDDAENAIAADGRVRAAIAPDRANDELSDLRRSFAQMLARLAQYNSYLETMAGKLAHELRTPIAVVRSSLDNLETNGAQGDGRVFITRAQEGIERLNDILTRMSEATRLEQTLQHETPLRFDVGEVVAGCLSGYRLAHDKQQFELHTAAPDATSLDVLGSPELIAQMLDKLIANAVDFADPGTPVIVRLQRSNGSVCLSVVNQGPPLPETMRQELFDSMVSVRSSESGQPHLGLGLYIVRLIADFHGGNVKAENRADTRGVVFHVTLPLAGT
ncbi:MAG: proteobacterial dedicated sortase system histidine kinase [Pseudomonadota bacterium]|nr:MAG: proteobacterial dedicated sortase system histidine kinase [Pseudomonadota bacterium]